MNLGLPEPGPSFGIAAVYKTSGIGHQVPATGVQFESSVVGLAVPATIGAAFQNQ